MPVESIPVRNGESMADITAFRFLFENYISGVSIPFQSEATEGLQIMGLLETRTLDFKNVILLSVNEGVLPTGKTVNSFIPQDVKQYFGLQTYKGKDAVFSYHFYRLLQRAENVYLLYSLDTKKGNAEKSRFIYQLKNELNTYPNIEITDEIISYPPVKLEAETPISIKKTDEMLAKLSEQKYSASSISTYLECELRFYFRYVLEIEDSNSFTLDDMLQGKTIGTVIHSILESAVENGRFKQMERSEIEQLVSERMCNTADLNLTKEDLLYEKNHLVFQIIIKYIDAYLKHAQSFEENIVIKNTEEKLERKLLIDNVSVHLKGIIDRIDLQNNITRIIDYKTGVVKNTELKIKDIEHSFDGEHTKAFQLLFYAYLYHKQHNTDFLEAEIVSFRKIWTPYILSIDKEKQLSPEHINDFEFLLIETIQSILNQDIPFSAITKIDRCKYCTYKDIFAM
jgi:CRISPR/Cas system-associated exonuclease Cas4 (RecB family)